MAAVRGILGRGTRYRTPQNQRGAEPLDDPSRDDLFLGGRVALSRSGYATIRPEATGAAPITLALVTPRGPNEVPPRSHGLSEEAGLGRYS